MYQVGDFPKGYDLCGRQLDKNSVVLSKTYHNASKFILNKWNREEKYLKYSEYINYDPHGYVIQSSFGNYGIILEDFYNIIPGLIEKCGYDNWMTFKTDYSQLSFDNLKDILERINPDKKMYDLLNKDLFVGDLVIYIDFHMFKYGIVISENSIYSETGHAKKVKFVYKIKSLTQDEIKIREKLKAVYTNVMANSVKGPDSNVGGIYKSGSFYYLNLGHMHLSYSLLEPSNYKLNIVLDDSKVLWLKFKEPSYKHDFLSSESGWSDEEILKYVFRDSLYSCNKEETIYQITDALYSTYYTVNSFSNLNHIKKVDKFKFKRKIKLLDNIEFDYLNYKFVLTRI